MALVLVRPRLRMRHRRRHHRVLHQPRRARPVDGGISRVTTHHAGAPLLVGEEWLAQATIGSATLAPAAPVAMAPRTTVASLAVAAPSAAVALAATTSSAAAALAAAAPPLATVVVHIPAQAITRGNHTVAVVQPIVEVVVRARLVAMGAGQAPAAHVGLQVGDGERFACRRAVPRGRAVRARTGDHGLGAVRSSREAFLWPFPRCL